MKSWQPTQKSCPKFTTVNTNFSTSSQSTKAQDYTSLRPPSKQWHHQYVHEIALLLARLFEVAA
jgi:hypothetical protein